MLVLISDLLSGFLILFITVLLNGDMGTKQFFPLPLVGLLHHRQFIKSPYMLLYFYVVLTVSFKFLVANTLAGLMLYLVLLGLQVFVLVFIFYKKYHKKSDSWLLYIERMTDILSRLKTTFRKPDTQAPSKNLSLSDIQYLLQQLIFPGVFLTTNAYLVTNLFIFLKII